MRGLMGSSITVDDCIDNLDRFGCLVEKKKTTPPCA